MSDFVAAGKFVLKWVVIGLAMAGVTLLLRPAWLMGTPPPVQSAAPAPPSYADAVARSSPAVVNIYTARVVNEQPPAYGGGNGSSPARRNVQNNLGSGVLVDSAGHVVTNNHLIKCAQQIWLQLADGRSAEAVVVGQDPDTDIAVLKIDLPQAPVMPLGRSDALRVGDIVLAIGNPYGLSQTVTQGIVSATGRGELGLSAFENFIQTDAAINLGNSGGALIDLKGELVGINTAILAQELGTEGIGFAIPVNLVRGVLEQILKHGKVKRGWLGVDGQSIDPRQAAALGLQPPTAIVVTHISPASPAARAGVLPGDLIVGINGQPHTAAEALTLVASTPPGTDIQLSTLRRGVRRDFTATLLERVIARDSSKDCAEFGG